MRGAPIQASGQRAGESGIAMLKTVLEPPG